nr:hypothetical protein GCM10020093_107600 [Planobispora longispora]
MGVTAAVSPGDGVVRLRSLQVDGPAVTVEDLDGAEGWMRYAVGVVWALREAGRPVRGADIVVDGDVPRGRGCRRAPRWRW